MKLYVQKREWLGISDPDFNDVNSNRNLMTKNLHTGNVLNENQNKRYYFFFLSREREGQKKIRIKKHFAITNTHTHTVHPLTTNALI